MKKRHTLRIDLLDNDTFELDITVDSAEVEPFEMSIEHGVLVIVHGDEQGAGLRSHLTFFPIQRIIRFDREFITIEEPKAKQLEIESEENKK